MKGARIIFLLAALIGVNLSVFAQINTTTIEVAKPSTGKKMQPTAPYDSTYNAPTNKTRFSFIGQIVYVQYSDNPKVDYAFFYPNQGEKADLMGRYYLVESIEDNTSGILSKYRPYTITFRDKDKDWKYFKCDYNFDDPFTAPWITVSYFNHLKSLIGDKYYCLQKKVAKKGLAYVDEWSISEHDIYTGEKIEITPFVTWELVDFKTHSETQRLIAIFKNGKGQTSFAEIVDFGITPLESYYLFPDKEYKRLTKKYGSYYTKMVLEGKFAKGMPKELFRLMMGTPYEINRSSYQDQWVYHKDGDIQCYYFENGKLTDWN